MATEDRDPNGLHAYGAVVPTPVREVGMDRAGTARCAADGEVVEGSLGAQSVESPTFDDDRLEDVDEVDVWGWLCGRHSPAIVLARPARGPDAERLPEEWIAAPLQLDDGRVLDVAVRADQLPDDYVAETTDR